MSDEMETAPSDPLPATSLSQPSVPRGALSRRALISGTAAALPTILTLHSGAALANASNLMVKGTASTSGAATEDGQYHCLHTGSQTSGTWNLNSGNRVTNLTVGKTYKYDSLSDENSGMVQTTGDAMCGAGAQRIDNTTDSRPKGMLLSLAAYTSLSAAGVLDPYPDL